MNSNRIKEIQETTAYPESVSVMIALNQVWNECEQDKILPNANDVKRWYQLLVGINEEEMMKDIKRTLNIF